MEQNGTCWVPEKCSEMAVESMLGCATAIYFSDRFFPIWKILGRRKVELFPMH